MSKVFANIALVIFSYYIVFFFYTGIKNPVPPLGDSWDYHIPISESILNGTFLNPSFVPRPQVYYPGSSEVINALLMSLSIPLTLSNLLAILILAVTLIKLGRTFNLSIYESLFFSLTFTMANAILRWANAVSADVWLAIFFSITLIILESFKGGKTSYLKLGLAGGLLVGTKYTGLFYLVLLGLFHGRTLIKKIDLKKLILFTIPFLIFGGFWYLRNFLLLGNPIYPLCLFNLPCVKIFNETVLQITMKHPGEMLNALFSEYKLLALMPIVVFFSKREEGYEPSAKWNRLFMLGLICLLFFLLNPTNSEYQTIVSSIRYSYPAFILLILLTFKIAKRHKKLELLGYTSIASALGVFSMPYHPKIVLMSLPCSLVLLWFVRILDKSSSRPNK